MQRSIFLSLAAASSAFAANCQPANPADCNRDSCTPCFCLGPDNILANAPVNPRTCDGDVVISASALYWKAAQDGMEYAIETNTRTDRSDIIDGEYKTPYFHKDIGFKIGLSYANSCDGWDIGILWTNFDGKASSSDQSELQLPINSYENRMLLPLWSAFSGLFPFAFDHVLVAGKIDTN